MLADDIQDIQRKTFTKWINIYLAKAKAPPISNLFEDLKDGEWILREKMVFCGVILAPFPFSSAFEFTKLCLPHRYRPPDASRSAYKQKIRKNITIQNSNRPHRAPKDNK